MGLIRWNSFTVIGAMLLIIGVVAQIKGASFIFDAGIPPEQFEPFYYIAVGVLFIVNGYITGSPLAKDVPEETKETASKKDVSSKAPVDPAKTV